MLVPYLYAIVRVVPDVERGERFNAGVVLFCRSRRFLAARTKLDRDKLAALAPARDDEALARQLMSLELVAAGDPAAGPLAQLEQAERFHWLVAPGSTTLQPSAVHAGLTADPAAVLNRLFHRLVDGS
jgi:hypothetical protein